MGQEPVEALARRWGSVKGKKPKIAADDGGSRRLKDRVGQNRVGVDVEAVVVVGVAQHCGFVAGRLAPAPRRPRCQQRPTCQQTGRTMSWLVDATNATRDFTPTVTVTFPSRSHEFTLHPHYVDATQRHV